MFKQYIVMDWSIPFSTKSHDQFTRKVKHLNLLEK